MVSTERTRSQIEFRIIQIITVLILIKMRILSIFLFTLASTCFLSSKGRSIQDGDSEYPNLENTRVERSHEKGNLECPPTRHLTKFFGKTCDRWVPVTMRSNYLDYSFVPLHLEEISLREKGAVTSPR